MKALILVDIQNDFSDNGSLPVNGSLNMIEYVNELSNKYKINGDLVVATMDFHPLSHISFASTHNKEPFTTINVSYGEQQLWPDHCIRNTYGSQLIELLNKSSIDKIIYKGTNLNVDSYSGFYENDSKSQTMLDSYLKSKNITELLIVGLALDYCVAFTAFDAVKLNYKVSIDLKATRSISDNNDKLFKQFEAANIKLINK